MGVRVATPTLYATVNMHSCLRRFLDVIARVAGDGGWSYIVDVLTTWLQSTLYTLHRIPMLLPLYLPTDARGLRFDNGRVSRCAG